MGGFFLLSDYACVFGHSLSVIRDWPLNSNYCNLWLFVWFIKYFITRRKSSTADDIYVNTQTGIHEILVKIATHKCFRKINRNLLSIVEINSDFLFQQTLIKMVTMMIILHCCSSYKDVGPAF